MKSQHLAEETNGVLGIFKYLDEFTHAIEEVKNKSEFSGFEAFSPTSYHEIEHACDFKPSPVRWFTLFGALTGTICGFLLPLCLDFDWPLIVGGKQPGVWSIIAYVVLGFELTILLGGISTVIGMLVMCRIPNPKIPILDPRLTDDRFGLFVPGADLNGSQVKTLKDLGAEEVRLLGVQK